NYGSYSIEDLKKLPKNEKIIVYCSVGYRSERVGEKLQKLGYQNVYNIYGGIFEWKNEGMPVVNRQNQPTDSVHTYNKNWSKWLLKGVKVY
ncbi:MAG: rhodanese-like domain-containing protein, partial [Cytophagales bacterium]|nr:rhodanese-like domain-containing protein [Cytophagales bacterium]